jgi:hypothetical protein
VLKIEFEEPEHGWMPVKILFDDIEEHFDVSDVPIDPITQLEDVLDSAITGGGGEIWWHLEPAGYYLNLHAEKEAYRIKLEFSEQSMKADRITIFNYLGDFDSVIVPLWRSLRKLQSYGWSEFNVSSKSMQSITEQVKHKQKVNKPLKSDAEKRAL